MKRDARTIVAAGAVLALLAAAGARPQAAPPLSAPAQPPASGPQAPAPPAADAGSSGSCEALSLAWLVGKPKSAIPVPVYPSMRRVYCSTCMVTQDYLPGRTDIVFDTETGIVTQVKCG